MSLNLNRLNPHQREAVRHGEGPLLILAGAGSGKTSTMAYRIAHLVADQQVSAQNILGLSFTNKAAQELKERVRKLVKETSGASAAKGLTISTFHSLCVRILRAHGDKIGFRSDFSILDQSDQKDILKQVMKNIRIDDRKFDLDVILFELGQAKNRFMGPDGAEAYFLESGRLSTDYGIAAASSYTRYQEQLKVLNSMDFDDLLFNAVTLLEKNSEVREAYNNKFRYILVDEYQDTNPAQFKLLSLLTQNTQNICVVGDDDQSIYAWRGADPTHILEFHHHFKGAKRITLDQNYRSTTNILDAANQVIRNNRKRHLKTLWSDRGEGEPITETILEADREEAKYVAEQIHHLAKEKTRPWKDFAVLYRSNAQSRLFEESMRMMRIPYKMVGGFSFLDRKEVKSTLAYWKLILNPQDDASLRRIVNWPARGIGKTALESLSDAAFKADQSIFDAMVDAQILAPRSAVNCGRFRELILGLRTQLQSIQSNSPLLAVPQLVDWGRRTLEVLAIKKAVDEEDDDPAAAARRWDNVEELVHALGQVPTDDQDSRETDKSVTGPELLQEFITRMTLNAQEELEDQKEAERDGKQKDEVTLLTLHGAKGLEYPIVFLVGMEDGFLPHQRTLNGLGELDEERRLCYVGITRAKDFLYLTRTKKRIRFGKEVPRYRSRFLAEIENDLILESDESMSGTPKFDKAARAEHEVKVKSHLDLIRGKLMGTM